MIIKLDHIAILTTSLEQCIDQLPIGFDPQEIEEQPAEGTREQYVFTQVEDSPTLLFLEPIQPGPYQTAMEKRGPGLHHLGCTTNSLDEAIGHLSNAGLLLHPISLKTYAEGVVWLCRPGVPYLIELVAIQNEVRQSQVEVLVELPKAATAAECFSQHIPDVLIRSSDKKTIEVSVKGQLISIRP